MMDINMEWENRVLCSDESCIGTIGADGCCRECGRVFAGELPLSFRGDREKVQIDNAEDKDLDMHDEREEFQDDDGLEPIADEAWERRTLCADGCCIGVIHEETGCCKECGKPYDKV